MEFTEQPWGLNVLDPSQLVYCPCGRFIRPGEGDPLDAVVRAHWWEGEYVSKDNRGIYIVWHDGEGMRLPERWFPTLRRGDYFGCRVWLDNSGIVRGVEAVGLLRQRSDSRPTTT